MFLLIIRTSRIIGKFQELDGHNETVFTLALLPNANGDLVSGIKQSKYGTRKMERKRQTLTGHTDWIRDLVAIDNNCLISASDDFLIIIWNINEGTIRKTLVGHSSCVYALLMLDNGDLASGSADKTIKIWNIEVGTVKKTLTGHTDAC